MKATDLCASLGYGHKSVQFHNQTAIYQPHPPFAQKHRPYANGLIKTSDKYAAQSAKIEMKMKMKRR